MSALPSPIRPTGSSKEAMFLQWVWDSIHQLRRVSDVQGVVTQRTTRGTVQIPKPTSVSGGGGTDPKVPRWG